MDTLLTTFLSPAPGMDQPPWAMQCRSLIERCFVDVDFKTSSSSKDKVNNDIGLTNFQKDRGHSFTQTSEMWISSPFLEFEITPYSYQPAPGPKSPTNQTTGFFENYFYHQLYHMALDRRTYSAFQTPSYRGCPDHFSGFGTMKEKKESRACCWQELFNRGMREKGSEEERSSCPCFMQEECNSYCDSHNLVIQDVAINKTNCFWSVYFKSPDDDIIFHSSDDGDYTRHGDGDKCIVNPCYNDGDDVMCDETFEIEFTNEIQPYSSEAFDYTNVHISCSTFGTDNSYDFYDLDDDDDFTEVTYESSDEEDCGEILHSGLVFSSSCTTNIIISNADAYEIRRLGPNSTDRSESQSRKPSSKYHQNCCGYSNESVSNERNIRRLSSTSVRSNSRKNSSGKQTKSVHFAQPDNLVTVHRLVTWSHAYKQARRGPWSRLAQDRAHFRRRIMNVSEKLDPVLEKKIAHAQIRMAQYLN